MDFVTDKTERHIVFLAVYIEKKINPTLQGKVKPKSKKEGIW